MALELKIYEPKTMPERIGWNKDEVLEAVNAKLAQYDNVILTEDQYDLIKKDRAALNKEKQAFDRWRIDTKKALQAPIATFEDEVKEVTSAYAKSIKKMDDFMKDIDDRVKAEKKEEIKKIWKEQVTDMDRVVTFDKFFDEKMLNKGYKIKAITEEAKALRDRVESELRTLANTCGGYYPSCKDTYIINFSMEDALKRKAELEEEEAKRKAYEEQKKSDEEAKKAQEEQNQQMSMFDVDIPPVEDPEIPPVEQEATFRQESIPEQYEQVPEDKMKVVTIRFTYPDRKEYSAPMNKLFGQLLPELRKYAEIEYL